MRLGRNATSLAKFGSADLCGCCIGGQAFGAFLADPARRSVLKGPLAGAAAGLSALPAAAEGDVGAMITPDLVTPDLGEPAVTVFTARVVNTMDPATEGATAVAVAGRRIVAVGSRAEVEGRGPQR
jgi:hypothetical protein